jgi:hypothetical protein
MNGASRATPTGRPRISPALCVVLIISTLSLTGSDVLTTS